MMILVGFVLYSLLCSAVESEVEQRLENRSSEMASVLRSEAFESFRRMYPGCIRNPLPSTLYSIISIPLMEVPDSRICQ